MRRTLLVAGGLAAVGTAIVVASVGVRRALASIGVGSAAPAPAAVRAGATTQPGGFSARSYTEGGVVYPYRIFFPRDYDASRRWPVLVSLHGADEKGSDGERPLEFGIGRYLKSPAAADFPAVVIIPQVPPRVRAPGFYGPIRRLIDGALRDVNADTTRLYLTGFSAGGVFGYNLLHHDPGRYAAVVPIGTVVTLLVGPNASRLPKPEAYAATARALGSSPIWIFHGARDNLVPVAEGREAARELEAAGARVRYTEFPEGDHDVRGEAFATPGFWTWLFGQHR